MVTGRAIRDALPGNPVAQERIVGRMLIALAIADVRAIIMLSSAALIEIIIGFSVSFHARIRVISWIN